MFEDIDHHLLERKHQMWTYIGDELARITGHDTILNICEITVFGKTYPSVQTACDELGCKGEYVKPRLRKLFRKTWTAAQSTEVQPSPEAINQAFFPGHIIARGRRFDSKGQAADHYGIPIGYVSRKLAEERKRNNGKTVSQEAIDAIFNLRNYKNRPGQIRPVRIRGQKYKSMKAACDAHGVDQQTVARKMALLKKPTQNQIDALFEPPKTHTRNPEPITVNGTQYRSISAACKATGMRQSTVDARLKRLPERTAFWIDTCFRKTGTPSAFRLKDWMNNIVVNGRAYPSIEAAAKANKADLKSVQKRLSELSEWIAQEQIEDCFQSSRTT